MDRFIENAAVNAANKNSHLKSNMDRFIVSASWRVWCAYAFKIQYG